MLHLTEGNGAVLQARYQANQETVDWRDDFSLMHHGPARAPWWLKLERDGVTVTGWHSEDGEVWTQIEQLQLDLPTNVLIGVAVTSHLNGELATGWFSNLTIEDPDAPPVGPDPEPQPDPDPEPDPEPDPDLPSGPTTTVVYGVDNGNFPNPERGWYAGSPNYNNGQTMSLRLVRLDDYRNQALPSSLLNNLRDYLQGMRNVGAKAVLRFSYNFGFAADAPLNRVLQHIEQVAPVLQEYGDVIAVLQAGFIGAWGEWHATTNNLLTQENRRTISTALLDALDDGRMIQIRYPSGARDIFALPTAATAFNGSNSSRVGQHNDCFLSTSGDGGTFENQQDRDYFEDVSRFTATGGETCQIAGVNERSDCPVALHELSLYHWDYLNSEFYSPIVDKWRNQGCYDEISRRLGYRFSMIETTSPTTITPGQTLAVDITMRNTGWGKLYNPRPMQLILQPTGGGNAITLTAYPDARRTLPLAGETTNIPIRVQVPNNTPSGSYTLQLNLPDNSPTLNTNPRYSIRLANTGTWNPNNGRNTLNITIQVE